MKRLFFPIHIFSAMFAVSLLSADFSGTWTIQSKDGDGRPVQAELSFREEGGALKAALKAGDVRHEIDNISRESDRVTFVVPWKDERVTVRIEATGDTLKGQWRTNDGDGSITGSRVAIGAQGIGGLWKLTSERPRGNVVKGELDLKDMGGYWKCSLRAADGAEVQIDQMTATPDQLSFRILTSRDTVQVQLKLQGEHLNGTWTATDRTTGAIEGRR